MAKKRSYHKKRKFKLKKDTVYTIFQISLFILSVLIFLSFFQQGPILTIINSKIDTFFGLGKFFIPVILFQIILAMSKLKFYLARPNTLIGISLIWVTLIGMFRGGSVGQSIWYNFEFFIGSLATGLILLGSLLIGLMVLFDTSIDEVFGLLRSLFNSFKKVSGGIAQTLTNKKKTPIYIQSELPIKTKTTSQQSLVSSQKPQQNKQQVQSQASDFGSNLLTSVPAQKMIWEYPPLNLLSEIGGQKADRGDMRSNAQIIERTLDSFGIAARVVEINKGPAVTQYALEIAMGTKLSKITTLQNDLALALAAPTGQIRIEAPIPGKSLVGVEIPNRSLEFVTLKTMLSSDVLKNSKSKLAVALGLDVSGQPVISDITKMPHVLVAGTTGSGKSVLINSWINSVLYRASPDEVKLIMVDPKRVELIGYNDIPHLMTPVIVEAEKTLKALRWAMAEMDRRYQEFAKMKVRNIESYNNLSGITLMPFILIFIDELADLMAFAPVEVEDAICRLAQMARATGIHLVLSTQRPSVDVITGLIKANIPCRIAFNVSSMIDSRVILDQPGAEKLLGRGDMLYIPPDQAKPTRIQGAFISEKEINNVVDFLKSKQSAHYTEEIANQTLVLKKQGGGEITSDGRDPLFAEALKIICQYKTASSSFLQRKFSIGFSRAARLLDQLEESGAVGQPEGSKPRDVLITDPSQILENTGNSSEVQS